MLLLVWAIRLLIYLYLISLLLKVTLILFVTKSGVIKNPPDRIFSNGGFFLILLHLLSAFLLLAPLVLSVAFFCGVALGCCSVFYCCVEAFVSVAS